jgi:hypothetical protein
MERGRIVESGGHQELLTRNGLYRRLYDMRYFETDTETELVGEGLHP